MVAEFDVSTLDAFDRGIPREARSTDRRDAGRPGSGTPAP